MSIAMFLRDEVGLKSAPQSLEALDHPTGQKIGNTQFYSGLEECADHLEPWMPIYFLPIGVEACYFDIGIHLRPPDVAAGRLAVISSDEAQMIEVARSLKDYVFRSVAILEGAVNENGPREAFNESVSRANLVFGENFYEPGRHGEFGEGDVEDLLIKLSMGEPYAYQMLAFFEEDTQEKLRVLEEGVKVEPGCMYLHASAAQAYKELGEDKRAAEAVARSLKCYRHTAYHTDLQEYYEMGRSLLKAQPDIFPGETHWDLAIGDEKERMELVMRLYQNGEVDDATKILCDMCYEFRDYSSVLDILQKHYSKLGWDWALALCDLRHSP